MTNVNSVNNINSVNCVNNPINNADSVNCVNSVNNGKCVNDADSIKKVVIIKAGALFSISSRAGGNNDLTLDELVHVKLYKNAVVNISGISYIYGPICPNNPNPNPINNIIVLEKGSRYRVNNVNIDPIGLTKMLDIEQKVCMNPCCPIILPSGTVLHTLDNIMEFTLTKAVHCTLA
jgi:hypothetical protein